MIDQSKLEASSLARLASLSEESRQVEQFRQRMANEKPQWIAQGAGGQWFQNLRALVQGSDAWQAADKAALLGLVQEISQLAPGLHPKKNKHIKELIRSLKA